jgi:hypothetical protein
MLWIGGLIGRENNDAALVEIGPEIDAGGMRRRSSYAVPALGAVGRSV